MTTKTLGDYYHLALELTYRQDQTVQPWVEHARALAEQLLAAAPLEGGVPPAGGIAVPGVSASPVTPPGVAGSRFGAAFVGWDDVALMQILLTCQQIVIARENGGSPEYHAELQKQLEGGIADLETRHREAAAKRKPM